MMQKQCYFIGGRENIQLHIPGLDIGVKTGSTLALKHVHCVSSSQLVTPRTIMYLTHTDGSTI